MVEWYWQGKSEVIGIALCQWHFAQCRSHTVATGIKPGTPWWQVVDEEWCRKLSCAHLELRSCDLTEGIFIASDGVRQLFVRADTYASCHPSLADPWSQKLLFYSTHFPRTFCFLFCVLVCFCFFSTLCSIIFLQFSIFRYDILLLLEVLYSSRFLLIPCI